MKVNVNEIYAFYEPLAPSEQPRRLDPWKDGPAPNLTKTSTLGALITKNEISKIAARIHADMPDIPMHTRVRYQDRYKMPGSAAIWDVEINGRLYRHFQRLIHVLRMEA